MKVVITFSLLLSSGLWACKEQETESRRSTGRADLETSSSQPEDSVGSSTEETKLDPQLASFALQAVNAPRQEEFDAFRVEASELSAEPSDAQLSMLIAMARQKFPALASAEFQQVDNLVVPAANDDMALAESRWQRQPRKSGTGPWGVSWTGSSASNTNGTVGGHITGQGPMGNVGSVGGVANPSIGAAGYVFGWVPGYGIGIAVGGVGVSGNSGGGWCGISLDGAGCGSF